MLVCLRATDRVDRLGQLLLDVKAIKRDLSLLQVLAHPRQVRLRHVLADLCDPLGIAAVPASTIARRIGQKTRELLDRFLIAPLGHEHRSPL